MTSWRKIQWSDHGGGGAGPRRLSSNAVVSPESRTRWRGQCALLHMTAVPGRRLRIGVQMSCQHKRIFDGNRRALRQRRHHRMRGVTQQADVAGCPARERTAVEERPLEDFRNEIMTILSCSKAAAESGQYSCPARRHRPEFLPPSHAGIAPAKKIQQFSGAQGENNIVPVGLRHSTTSL